MNESSTDADVTNTDGLARVDPRAPRFGQAITAIGLAVGLLLQLPVLVYAVTAVLLTSVLSGWRVDVYGLVWKSLLLPRLDPADPEPAAPHRFAKLVGATGTTVASVLLLIGLPTAGYAIAGLVALAAGLAAVTGICLGCRMYRSVSLFRQLDVV